MSVLLQQHCCRAQATKPAPPTPIDAKKAELGGKTWDPAWDQIVEQAIPADMLSSQVPHDVKRFCPRFYTMSDTDKRVFWAYFFQALAGAEAGLNPTTRVRHTEPEVAVTDKVTASRCAQRRPAAADLSRIRSAMAATSIGTKDRDLRATIRNKTILQPKNNLQCGVKILENQIITQHNGLVSRKSYWSTLQPGTVSYRVSQGDDESSCRVRKRPRARPQS